MNERSQVERGLETTRDIRSLQRDGQRGDGVDSDSEIPIEQLDLHALTRIGDYQLCREIGRGGMGIVYEATELSLQRQVALKVLPVASHFDPMLTKRFNNESRAAAHLNHPNIIPVYAVGSTDTINFFAMHLVQGRNLHRIIKDIRAELADASTKGHRADATVHDSQLTGKENGKEDRRKSSQNPRSDSPHDERVELSATDFVTRSGRHFSTLRVAHAVARLGAKVADALQHAHEMGIIHRDIKPSNLMLDVHGKVWVTDFGLAQIQNTPSLTRTGVLLGTLRYMSPEQATGVRTFVDHRTDIYSLAVTLCELLTLQRLVVGKTTEEILGQIIYGAPVRIRRIDPSVPEDIAVILEKAMAKNPMERYATAGEMAEDLNRFLRNEAIKAKRPNALKRCRRWLERHQAVATITGAALAAIFILSLVATGAIWRTLQAEIVQRERAVAALTVSEALRFLAISSLELADDPGLSLVLAKEGEKAAPKLEANRVLQAAMDVGHEYAAVIPRELVSTHVTISPDADTAITCVSSEVLKSGSYPAIVHRMSDGTEIRKLDSGDCITSAAFSPDGDYVVTASKAFADKDGVTPLSEAPVLWEAATGKKVRVFSGATLIQAHSGIFQRDSDRMVLCHGNEAHIFDFASGQAKVRLRGHSDQVVYAEFSPNGKRVLTISDDKAIRVWDSQTGRELRPPIQWETTNRRRLNVHFVASSEALVVCENDTIMLYPAVVSEDKSTKPLAVANANRIAASRAIDQVASFGIERAVILSAKNLEPICELSLPSEVTNIRFHPTGPRVLVTCGKQMFLYNSETGDLLGELRGHHVSVTDACFAPAGDALASVSVDRTLRLWHAESGLARRTFRSPADVYRAPSPAQVAMSLNDQSIAVCDRLDFFTSLRDSTGASLSSDMLGMASGGRGDTERLVLVRGNTVTVSESSTSREIYRGSFSDDLTPETRLVDQGRHLLVHTRSSRAYLVDLNSHSRRRLGDSGDSISTAVVSADSTVAVLAAESGRFFAIDTATGDLLWSRRHEMPIVDLDLSPDHQMLATIDSAGNLQVWKSGGEKPVAVSASEKRPVCRVKFVDDGQHVVTWHSLENQEVRCHETQNLESYVDYPAAGMIWVSAHPTQPLLGIGTDQQAVLWNYADESVRPLADRGCRSICLLEDQVAMLLSRTASEPSALQIRSIEDDELVHEEALELTPASIIGDLQRNQFLVTGLGYAANVFHFQTGRWKFSSAAHASPIVLAGFSAPKHELITVSEDGLVLISDETGNVLRRAGTVAQKVTAAALDERGEMLLVGSVTGELALCSIQNGSQVVLKGHSSPVRSIRLDSSGNKAITVAAGEPVRYWDLRTHNAKEINVPDALHAEVAGESVLVIAGEPRSLKHKAWLVVDGQNEAIDITQSQGTIMGLFSPDRQRIGLLAPDGRLDILRLQDREIECSISDATKHIVRFAFAPDGKRLLTAESGVCSLWSLPSCTRISQVACSKSQIAQFDRWMPFSHNGAWYLTMDTEVRKVACDPAEVAETAIHRELTEAERRRFRMDLSDFVKESN